MIKRINEILKTNEDLKNTVQQLLDNEKYRILLYSLSKTSPVMQWAKDINGVYTFANDALAKHLFDSNCGEDLVGKNDVQIVSEIIKKYPRWTFGTICVGTDQITLEKEETLKFFEWGIVKHKFQYVVAYKAPYYDKKGKLLGTTGIAIFVTEEVEELKNIMESTSDENTKQKLKNIYKDMDFEQKVFSNQNINNVWEK
jgi:hypothetical protein